MSLLQTLGKNGRFPPVTIHVVPVGRNANPFVFPRYSTKTGHVSAGFLNYTWDSNVLVPVNKFSFSFQGPGEKTVSKICQDGDVIFIFAGGQQIAAGVIDAVEYHLSDRGEMLSIHGRDLMAYLEDRQAVDDKNTPIYWDNVLVEDAAVKIITDTRIPSVLFQDTPKVPYAFTTNPGESWLSAFLRFIEPLNLLTWIDRSGALVVGRPNFEQEISGRLYAVHSQRKSNVTEARVVRNSSQIPNIIIPLWAGQENATQALAASQAFYNTASRPNNLRLAGHKIVKTYVSSNPNGADPQAQNLVAGKVATGAADSLLIEAYAKRELARFNMQELLVDVTVPGHYKTDGTPFEVDTTWQVHIEHADVNEKMYCYGVKYNLDESSGQTTTLSLCKLGTIVGDARF